MVSVYRLNVEAINIFSKINLRFKKIISIDIGNYLHVIKLMWMLKVRKLFSYW